MQLATETSLELFREQEEEELNIAWKMILSKTLNVFMVTCGVQIVAAQNGEIFGVQKAV